MENTYFESPENKQIIHEYMFVNNLPDQNDTQKNVGMIANHYDALAETFAEKEFKNYSDIDSFMFSFENGDINKIAYDKTDEYLSEKGFKGFESEFGFVPLMLAGALADKKTRAKLTKGAGQVGKFLAKNIKGGKDIISKLQTEKRDQKIVDNKTAILETGRSINESKKANKDAENQEKTIKLANRLLNLKRKAISKHGPNDPFVTKIDQTLASKYNNVSVVDALEDAFDRYKTSEKTNEINKMLPTIIIISLVLVYVGYMFGKK